MKKLFLFLALLLLPLLASADENGECGDGVTYSFEEETGTLTISKTGEGTGKMTDYTIDIQTPWNSYQKNSHQAVVEGGVTSIGSFALYDCSGLTSITIGNTVTSIGRGAFWGCSSLTSIDIPNSVTSIGPYAFEDCSGLTSVSVEAVTPPSLKNNSFSNYDIPLFVPEESVGLYQSTSPWNKFSEIKSLSGTEPDQVVKPIITLKDGKLSFSSETEGATFIYSLSTPAAANGEGHTLTLQTNYTVTVYAKKEGMRNSEIVTKTFDIRGLKGDINEDGSVDAVNITKLVEIVIDKSDGEPGISTDNIDTGDAGEAVSRKQ